MYWNNCWLNFFNKTNFFDKTIFLENLFKFFFSEKLFKFFFKKKLNKKSFFFYKKYFNNKLTKKNSFKKRNLVLLKALDKRRTKLRAIKYNFTKIWIIKYNNYILLSTFCFFFFKVKKISKKSKKISNLIINKIQFVFWKKRRKKIFKRFFVSNKNYLIF